MLMLMEKTSLIKLLYVASSSRSARACLLNKQKMQFFGLSSNPGKGGFN